VRLHGDRQALKRGNPADSALIAVTLPSNSRSPDAVRLD